MVYRFFRRFKNVHGSGAKTLIDPVPYELLASKFYFVSNVEKLVEI
jgi:hypothetical protein